MSRTLSEAESKRLLAGYGVPLAAERRGATVEAAVAAAEELGFPVVAKLNGPAIAHKTERGLVRLGLRRRRRRPPRRRASSSPRRRPPTATSTCSSPR